MAALRTGAALSVRLYPSPAHGGSCEHGPPRAPPGPGVEVRSQGWTHTREHPRPATRNPIPPNPHTHRGPEAHQTEGFRKSRLQGTLLCLDIGRPCAEMPKARMRSEGSRASAHERSSPSGDSTACCPPAPAGGAAPAGRPDGMRAPPRRPPCTHPGLSAFTLEAPLLCRPSVLPLPSDLPSPASCHPQTSCPPQRPVPGRRLSLRACMGLRVGTFLRLQVGQSHSSGACVQRTVSGYWRGRAPGPRPSPGSCVCRRSPSWPPYLFHSAGTCTRNTPTAA